MLMRRARAHSSFCSQVILVYAHPFCLKLFYFNIYFYTLFTFFILGN